MYDPQIAERLRGFGHDAVHVSDRPDLKAAGDELIFNVAQNERRAIFTNNVRDFMPVVHVAIQGGAVFYGVVFSNDRSLPRMKSNTSTIASLLHTLLEQHADDETLPSGVHWLP